MIRQYITDYSLSLLKRNTEPKIKIIPITEKVESCSLKIITLKIVAAIGSRIPRDDAVPAGISCKARV